MKIAAFDPSLVNLGHAYGEMVGDILYIRKVGTFQPDKYIKRTGRFDCTDVDVGRQMAVRYFLQEALHTFVPVAISGESIFYNGQNPKTLINQSKSLGLISLTLSQYLEEIHSPFGVMLYQPNVIKTEVGLIRGVDDFKDKTMINKYLYSHIKAGRIVYDNESDLPDNQLDHANDAAAMLYVLSQRIRKFNRFDINYGA